MEPVELNNLKACQCRISHIYITTKTTFVFQTQRRLVAKTRDKIIHPYPLSDERRAIKIPPAGYWTPPNVNPTACSHLPGTGSSIMIVMPAFQGPAVKWEDILG